MAGIFGGSAKAGRGFSEEFGTDSSGIILNESAVVMLGIEPKEVIGLRLTKDFYRPDKENMEFLTVIGVIKNFHYETMRNAASKKVESEKCWVQVSRKL